MKTDESEVREIDRLRARLAEMETERHRLTALVESSPVGVMVVDAATRTSRGSTRRPRASWACRRSPAHRS